MAKFTLIVETPTTHKPNTRPADVEERARIQAALLIVVSAVSNNGAYDGELANPRGGCAKFSYEVENV